MKSRPIELDPLKIRGLRVHEILKISTVGGVTEALQIVLPAGDSIIFTVWTDWSLLVENRVDSRLPSYLWPESDFLVRSLGWDIPTGGLEVTQVALHLNSIDVLVGVDIELHGHVMSIASTGGDLELSFS
ncbi:hypothetical protein [Amycolatopsis sp.]|uniref:hypothetical protein n=1 Tax=Amycolatopsis sp. TaxID=37632 RepID=UPI0026203C9A|nr:hypothetical protein [Amycolatopsis sp.]